MIVDCASGGLRHGRGTSVAQCGDVRASSVCDSGRGRRQRRRWLLVGAASAVLVLVLASVVSAVWQIAYGGLAGGDAAGVLGVPLGAACLTVALMALRRPVEGATRSSRAAGPKRWSGRSPTARAEYIGSCWATTPSTSTCATSYSTLRLAPRRPCPPGRSMPGSTRRRERGRCRTCWPTTAPPAPPGSSSPARPERAMQLDCEHRKALQFA